MEKGDKDLEVIIETLTQRVKELEDIALSFCYSINFDDFRYSKNPKIFLRAWEIENHPSVRVDVTKMAAKRPIFFLIFSHFERMMLLISLIHIQILLFFSSFKF